jgi:ketosteroid isomerase-like protein
MSQENVELAQTGYAVLKDAYRTGDFRAGIEEFCDPTIVLTPSGAFPESSEMHGYEGMVRFATLQTEAFDEFWIELQEFIDAGDRVVVPVRFGGRALYTGIDVEFEFVHVCTARNGRWTRVDIYVTRTEALRAVGLEG